MYADNLCLLILWVRTARSVDKMPPVIQILPDNCSVPVPESSNGSSIYSEGCLPNTTHEAFFETENALAYSSSHILSMAGNVFGILSILLNFGFLVAVRSIRSPLPYNSLLQNLSIADILASVTFLITQNWPQGPFASIDPGDDLFLTEGLPYVFRSTPWMFFTAYVLTLTCLTVNHYVAVCRPWKYSQIAECNLICKSLTTVWLLSSLQIVIPATILGFLCMLQDRHKAMDALYRVSSIEIQAWMTLFALSTFVNVILDMLVYKKIKLLKFKRRHTMYTSQENRNIQSKHEAFVTVSLLILASIFCRLPFPLIGILWFNLSTVLSPHGLSVVNALAVLLLYINFFVDPLIYALRMKEVRKYCVRLAFQCISTVWKHGSDLSTPHGVHHSIVPGHKELTQLTSTAEVRRASSIRESDVRSEL